MAGRTGAGGGSAEGKASNAVARGRKRPQQPGKAIAGASSFDSGRVASGCHAQTLAKNLSDPTVGEVRISAVDAWSAYISTIVEQTSRQYPKLTYRVVFGDSDMLVSGLRNRTLDVVITRATIARPLPDLNAEVLFHDRIVVVASVTHPLTRRRKLAFRDLLEERWVIGPPGSFLYQLLTEALQTQGLPMPKAIVTTLSIQLRLDLLQSGHFVTADSSSMMNHPGRRGRIKALPVELGDIAGPMAAVTLKGRQPPGPLKLFLTEARAVGKTISVRNESF